MCVLKTLDTEVRGGVAETDGAICIFHALDAVGPLGVTDTIGTVAVLLALYTGEQCLMTASLLTVVIGETSDTHAQVWMAASVVGALGIVDARETALVRPFETLRPRRAVFVAFTVGVGTRG